MKLIKKLDMRSGKNDKYYKLWGLFWCPFCESEVEKNLSAGKKAKSCGCNRGKGLKNNYKHGESKTRLYGVWRDMKKRCLNLNHKAYNNYGGRGIAVYPEWTDKENGFINFRDWALTQGYKEGLQIDRRINDGNYEPNNCRWVTAKENLRNRRNNVLTLEKANEIGELDKTGDYTQTKLAEIYNVDRQTISAIINNKMWTDEQ